MAANMKETFWKGNESVKDHLHGQMVRVTKVSSSMGNATAMESIIMAMARDMKALGCKVSKRGLGAIFGKQ